MHPRVSLSLLAAASFAGVAFVPGSPDSIASLSAPSRVPVAPPNSLRQIATPILFVATPGNEVVPGYIKVKFSPARAAEVQSAARKAGGGMTRGAFLSRSVPLPGALQQSEFRSRVHSTGWTLWRLPAGIDTRAAAATLRKQPGVLSAEPLLKIYALGLRGSDADWGYVERGEPMITLGDDIEFYRLWHLDDTGARSPLSGPNEGLAAAFDDYPGKFFTASTRPKDSPLIAVIDTGADLNHPDFRNTADVAIPNPTSDVSQGGQFEMALGTSFSFGENVGQLPNDIQGHGTHVTGLALAAADNGATFNGKGFPGTGYNCRGMILRVFDDSGNGSDADAAAAIYYAADNGADIINLSLGTKEFSLLMQEAVTYAFQKGCVVMAAGNESGSGGGDLGPIYPAACTGVIAVTANGPNGVHAGGSGSSLTPGYAGTGRYLDIAAPGGNAVIDFTSIEDIKIWEQYIWSTTVRVDHPLMTAFQGGPPKGYDLGYGYLIGTSMATPIASGAMGLYYGKFKLKRDQGFANVRAMRALQRSVVSVYGAPKGSWEPTQGYGTLWIPFLLAELDARTAEAGAIEGMVYDEGDPRSNISVRAQRDGSTTRFSTTTQADGTYRFDQLPAGTYTVTAAPGGKSKSRRVIVVPGSDTPAVNLWCGAFTGDVTAPTIVRFDVVSATSKGLELRHWGYDTETGIDRLVVSIGTSAGANDILADREIILESANVTLDGLALQSNRTYHLRATYTNGGGMSSTVDRSFLAGPTVVNGALSIPGRNATTTPLSAVIEVREPGKTAVLATRTVTLGANGSFSTPLHMYGKFDLAVKPTNALRRLMPNVTLGQSTPISMSGSTFNGDATNDNRVNAADLAALRAAFGSTTGSANWNAAADLNGDGRVNASDLAIVRANFGRTGDR